LSEDEEEDEEQAQFNFDVTGYSLKYSRCQMVEQYNDEAAEGGEDGQSSSPLVKKRFAILRLCPTSSCNASKKVGCTSGYGQYMVEMDTYLQAMQQYREDLQEGYCNYCEDYMQAVYEAVENGEDEVDEDDMDRVRRKRRLEGAEEEEEGDEMDEDEDEREEEDEDEDEEEDKEVSVVHLCVILSIHFKFSRRNSFRKKKTKRIMRKKIWRMKRMLKKKRKKKKLKRMPRLTIALLIITVTA